MEADSNLTPKNPKKRNRIASPSETVINIDNNLIQTSMTQLEKTENNLKDIRNELLEVKETIEKKQTQIPEKSNKTIKIIIRNHDIEHIDVNSLNKNNVENFKIKNAKK